MSGDKSALTAESTNPKEFASKTKEQIWKKDRIKKDNHNISKAFIYKML
jgi:hypothetical protein